MYVLHINHKPKIYTRYTHTHTQKKRIQMQHKDSHQKKEQKTTTVKIINETVITALEIQHSKYMDQCQSKDRVAEWIQKTNRLPFKSKNTLKTESEGMEKGIPCNGNRPN